MFFACLWRNRMFGLKIERCLDFSYCLQKLKASTNMWKAFTITFFFQVPKKLVFMLIDLSNVVQITDNRSEQIELTQYLQVNIAKDLYKRLNFKQKQHHTLVISSFGNDNDSSAFCNSFFCPRCSNWNNFLFMNQFC